ncbi:MAG: sulfurtransferase [Woeseia sp.]
MQGYGGLVSVDELSRHLDDPNWRIVDCRFDLMNTEKGREDFAAGHIPGAVYAHLDNDLAAAISPETGRHPLPDVPVIEATLRRYGISSGTQVVVYDAAGGGLAARLWWMLRWLGHSRVAVLDGGMAAWRGQALDVEQAAKTPPQGAFHANPRPEWVIDTNELSERLGGDTAPLLVDAREASRYLGQSEPIDSRAGHVPGAVNYPFAENLQADGHWRTPAQLATQWDALFSGKVPSEWAVMCGSGVTACHLALSAHLAGLTPPRLYPGSWSEWIRDPARPVAP